MITNLQKVNVETFGFVEREKDSSGKSLKYRCGRDFLYYVLHYYYPESFNANKNNPKQIENSRLFGMRLPWWLMWTQLQFKSLSHTLKRYDLELSINGKIVRNFFNFFTAISFPKNINVEFAISQIQKAVDDGVASAIDLSLGAGGLVDHVLFVYGYDEENLYVFDTHKVGKLEYEKISDGDKYYMKLPKNIIRQRWSPFGRFWLVRQSSLALK
jgi:hypothetical protein